MNDIEKAFAWFDEQAKEGKDLSICWEGGGDSGWAYFTLDGENIENEHTELVVDLMYENLDYGSWAGEFYASGEAAYDPDSKTFEGIDSCCSDEGTSNMISDNPIVFEIPKHFAFDLLAIMTEDENCCTTAAFAGMNRFQRPDESEFLDKLSEDIRNAILDRVEKYKQSPGASGNEISSFWNEYTLRRSEMTDNGDIYIACIDEIYFTESECEERNMMIDLAGMLENAE
jgi:hypothetical protein